MTRRSRSVIGGMAAAMALMALPAASQAACFSSTPSAQAITDSPADGEGGLAPELAGVGITVDGACGVAFDPVVTNRTGLIDGDGIGIYVDTDGNPATGSATFQGADRVIIVVGRTGPDLPPGLGTWDGVDFSFAGAQMLPGVGQAGARATLDQLGVPASGNIAVRVGAIWKGLFDTYGDFAPEPLASPFSMPVAFSSQAPVPVVPDPALAPVTVPAATTSKAASRKPCRVPVVRGMSMGRAQTKLSAAGCRYTIRRVSSKVRRGYVVSTSVRPRTRTSATVVVKVSRGGRGAAGRIASADAASAYAAINDRLVAQQAGAR